VGVIICAKDDERYYDNLINSKTLLESKLHKSLVEHLNSEITLVSDGRFLQFSLITEVVFLVSVRSPTWTTRWRGWVELS